MLVCTSALAFGLPVAGQQADAAPSGDRWSVHFQATSIGQHHGPFYSLYEGENSLPPHPESRASITATAFLAFRLNSWAEVVVNPEIAGGKGFGNVTGIAGFTNGEIPRVAQATPTLYLARGYVLARWAIGPEKRMIEAGPNEPGGTAPARCFSVIVGKFALTDYFDNNSYSHDPRRQFMNWSLMSNGAWDYPADTRGYTIGTMQELAMRGWSLRAATVLEPTEANGPTLDTRIAKNRGEAVEWEKRFQPGGRGGALRVLGFLNRERAGTFRDALLASGTADLAGTRRPGTGKYGWGLNVEQAITASIGAFARYGWSDGKTEAWAFTQIDRSLSGGISVNGILWHRKSDHIGAGAVRNYLSGDQRNYLAHGGLGFIIGDGRLDRYRPESVVEAYYSWRLLKDWTATADIQRVWNPAYNADRGPVSVGTIRLHWER